MSRTPLDTAHAEIARLRALTQPQPCGHPRQAIASSGGCAWCEEVARLRAALAPFADIHQEGTEDYFDDHPATIIIGRATDYTLRLGNFRRAAAALAAAPAPAKGGKVLIPTLCVCGHAEYRHRSAGPCSTPGCSCECYERAEQPAKGGE